MGLFHEYEGNKITEKENPRSRIPRLVLRSFGVKQKRPLSGEENIDVGHSSNYSKGTISITSSSSGDSGCPKDQVTVPSFRDNNPMSSTMLGERKRNRKTVRVYVMTGCSALLPRHKKEQTLSGHVTGVEVDVSSSNSTGSRGKLRQSSAANTMGKKGPLPRRIFPSRSSRDGPKPSAQNPESHGPCQTPERISFLSSRHSNPSSMRRYHSCGDNHGIQPPSPEQYLTPLQQKEVIIRHLRSKLKECESRSRTRDLEVEELKAQLCRMREDWIEEECHRVEAQLALKEARKEIAQLRQVVETMRSSLVQKDKGIQKYFIDINVQNRKLEALLHIMEMAQSGSTNEGPVLEDQVAQEMTDSGLVISDEGPDWTDVSDRASSADSDLKIEPFKSEMLVGDKLGGHFASACPPALLMEKAVQTDATPEPPDLQTLLIHLLKFRDASVLQNTETAEPITVVPADPKPAVSCSDKAGHGKGQHGTAVDIPGGTVVAKRYWSNSFLVDLAALAAPVLPTVAWLYCTHRAGTEPVYNIGALIRGCCIMGLHSLRRVSLGPGA